MDSAVIVGIMSCIGTAIVSITSVAISNRLITYRLDQLEDKVKKHNNFMERLQKAEYDIAAHKEAIDGIKDIIA